MAAFPISADPQYLLPTWVPASAHQPAPLETRGDLGSPRLNSPRGDHRQTPPHAPQERLSPKRGECGTPRSVGGNKKQGSRWGACGGFAKGLVWNNTGLSGPTSGGTPGRLKAGTGTGVGTPTPTAARVKRPKVEMTHTSVAGGGRTRRGPSDSGVSVSPKQEGGSDTCFNADAPRGRNYAE